MTPKRKPYNPGLSEKAWIELHRKIVRWNIKIANREEKRKAAK